MRGGLKPGNRKKPNVAGVGGPTASSVVPPCHGTRRWPSRDRAVGVTPERVADDRAARVTSVSGLDGRAGGRRCRPPGGQQRRRRGCSFSLCLVRPLPSALGAAAIPASAFLENQLCFSFLTLELKLRSPSSASEGFLFESSAATCFVTAVGGSQFFVFWQRAFWEKQKV